jgi:hypothetical protein
LIKPERRAGQIGYDVPVRAASSLSFVRMSKGR